MTPASALRTAGVDAEFGEQGRQAKLLMRPQADLLDPDVAGARQTQGVDMGVWMSFAVAAAPLACAPRTTI